ncbi:hypothetical protein X975_15354, partial [Stegodyphus mimosarum]
MTSRCFLYYLACYCCGSVSCRINRIYKITIIKLSI